VEVVGCLTLYLIFLHGIKIKKKTVTFLNMPWRSDCFVEEVFSGKRDTSSLGITLLMCYIIRILVI